MLLNVSPRHVFFNTFFVGNQKGQSVTLAFARKTRSPSTSLSFSIHQTRQNPYSSDDNRLTRITPQCNRRRISLQAINRPWRLSLQTCTLEIAQPVTKIQTGVATTNAKASRNADIRVWTKEKRSKEKRSHPPNLVYLGNSGIQIIKGTEKREFYDVSNGRVLAIKVSASPSGQRSRAVGRASGRR